MAQENGTISAVTLDGPTVIRDMFPEDPAIVYLNPLELEVEIGTHVTMDVDFSGQEPIATLISIIVPPGTFPLTDGDSVTLKAADDLVPLFEALNLFGSCDRRTYEAARIGETTGIVSEITDLNFTFTKAPLAEDEAATSQILPQSAVFSNEH